LIIDSSLTARCVTACKLSGFETIGPNMHEVDIIAFMKAGPSKTKGAGAKSMRTGLFLQKPWAVRSIITI
jgi:hypothetical protein